MPPSVHGTCNQLYDFDIKVPIKPNIRNLANWQPFLNCTSSQQNIQKYSFLEKLSIEQNFMYKLRKMKLKIINCLKKRILITLFLVQTEALSAIQCSCSEITLSQECLYAGCDWKSSESTNILQCFDKQPTNQPNCSAYQDQLVCDFLQGCAWNNQGKCAPFTQCSDYTIDLYDTSDNCYLKDNSCTNGSLNNHGFITCQSIDEFCHDYTNELMKIDFDNQKSFIIHNSNETAIDNFRQSILKHCSIQQSGFKGCSMIKNQIICKFIKNKFKTLICEWINNQCIEAMNTPQLSAEMCYLETGGTHFWQDNQCQMCKGNLQLNNDQNNENYRLLAEVGNAPTYTQSYKNFITYWHTDKVVYPSFTNVGNCSYSKLITSTYLCFTNDCQKSTISKQQTLCKLFQGQGEKLDMTSVSYSDRLCSTDSKIQTVKNSMTYTATNETTICFSSGTDVYYQNGTRVSSTAGKDNSTNTCQSQQVMNSTTVGNSLTKCTKITDSYKGLTLQTTNTCNTNTEELIQSDISDPSQPFTFTTSLQQCTQITVNQSKPIESQVHKTTSKTPKQGETHQIKTQIEESLKMAENDCQYNFTVNSIINKINESFFNKSINTINKNDCQSYLDNNPQSKWIQTYVSNLTFIQNKINDSFIKELKITISEADSQSYPNNDPQNKVIDHTISNETQQIEIYNFDYSLAANP